MKFPFKKPRGETILLKKGWWYLTHHIEKNKEITVCILHACKEATEYDKGLQKGDYLSDMDEGHCTFCNEPVPSLLIVTKNLTERG